MALTSQYRWVNIGELLIRKQKTAPDDVPGFNLEDLIAALTAALETEDDQRSFSNETRTMWCSSIGDAVTHYKMLIHAGDKRIPDPAFLDFTTRISRTAGKTDDEGGHFCGHVTISKTPNAAGRYIIAVEKVPNVNFTTLNAHFNWVFSKAIAQKAYLAGAEEKLYSAKTELMGYQSKTLQEAMTTGIVQDIEFIGQQTQKQGVDEDPLVREITSKVSWQVKRRPDDVLARQLIREAIDFVRGWEDVENSKVLVRLKAENGQIKTTEITADSEDTEEATNEALNNVFCLNEIVNNFEVPLPQVYNETREDMIEKMIIFN